MTGFHESWRAAGKDVSVGSRSWYRAFLAPWEPAPPPPQAPQSIVGKQVAAMLARLRERRAGSPVRQVSSPRKARKRRKGEVTISEYGSARNLGPRQVRRAMHELGLLQIEIEARQNEFGLPEYRETLRLTPEAVGKGLGRRISPVNGPEYDVLTPRGQQWADRRQKPSPVSSRHITRETIRGHLDQGRTQAEIVRLTGLSRQIVSHHARKLAA